MSFSRVVARVASERRDPLGRMLLINRDHPTKNRIFDAARFRNPNRVPSLPASSARLLV
jgi:hypothetical protein